MRKSASNRTIEVKTNLRPKNNIGKVFGNDLSLIPLNQWSHFFLLGCLAVTVFVFFNQRYKQTGNTLRQSDVTNIAEVIAPGFLIHPFWIA